MSIQYPAPGFEITTHGYETPPLTTRQGLLLYCLSCVLWKSGVQLKNLITYIKEQSKFKNICNSKLKNGRLTSPKESL